MVFNHSPASYIMDRRREDEVRLLRSSRASDDDLEAFEAPDVNHPRPYVSIEDSTDDLHRSRLPDQKGQGRYGVRSPVRTFRRTRYTIKHACYGLGLLTALLMTFVLGASLAPRQSMILSSWKQKSPEWVKPEGFKIVGLVFCQSLHT